eukprot:g4706.t1
MGTAQENNNPSVALSNSVVSAHSSFENNVVVEEWKGKIDREFTLEKLPPSRSSAALMIQNFFRSFRNRRAFKIIKTVLAQAEETIKLFKAIMLERLKTKVYIQGGSIKNLFHV